MKKIKTKNDLYFLIFSLVELILFTLSIAQPLVFKNDVSLFVVHVFNPTTHDFTGKLESFYGPIIILLTYLSFIPNFFDLKILSNKNNSIIALCIKISCLLSIIFALMNYLRVIYPTSFLSSGDVSIFQGGFYSLLFFIGFNIIDSFTYLVMIQKTQTTHKTEILNEKEGKLLRFMQIFAFIGIFAFLSTYCVPFFRNYTEYMKEAGFEKVLDKRTSVNYLLLAMYDNNFDFTVLSFLSIRANIYTPLTIIMKKDEISIIRIAVANLISILLLLLAVLIGLENIQLITPILKLRVDYVCCIFITILFVIYIANIIFSMILIRDKSKREHD